MRISFSSPYRESAIDNLAAYCAKKGVLANYWVPINETALSALGRLPVVGKRADQISRRLAHGTSSTPVTPIWAIATKTAYRTGRMPKHLLAWQGSRLDRAVAALLEKKRPDVLVGMPYASLESFRRARNLGIKTIFNHVNADSRIENREWEIEAELANSREERDEILRERWPNFIIERVEEEVDVANLVISPSRHVTHDLVSRGVDQSKIVQVPYGVDAESFQHFDRSGRTGPLNILYVGHVGYRKGLKYLADGARMLGANVNLIVVGPIVNRSRILDRLPIEVAYHGVISRERLRDIYGTADVFVLPSLAEGMARVVLEAMATGLPTIVTPNTGGAEIVRNGIDGFVIPARDAEAIASRLSILVADEELRLEMGRSSRSQARNFTWHSFARAVLDQSFTRIGTHG